MSTLSVPLTPQLEKRIEELIASGYAPNKAEVMRKALKKAAEDEVVSRILSASADPVILYGDIDELARQFPDND